MATLAAEQETIPHAVMNPPQEDAAPLSEDGLGQENALRRSASQLFGSITRASGFAYTTGNVLNMVAGYLMPSGRESKGEGDRNLVKVAQGGLAFMHSTLFMLDAGNKQDAKVAPIIAELDGALAHAARGEDGALALGEPSNPPAAPQEQLRENAYSIANSFVVGANMLGVVSGLRRGNNWEVGNGLVNAGAFTWATAVKPTVADHQDRSWSDPKKYLNYATSNPSDIGGKVSFAGTALGFAAGLRDFVSSKVPAIAGLVQMAAYSVFALGDYLMMPISREQKQRAKDFESELIGGVLDRLAQHGLLDNPAKQDKVLESVSQYLEANAKVAQSQELLMDALQKGLAERANDMSAVNSLPR